MSNILLLFTAAAKSSCQPANLSIRTKKEEGKLMNQLENDNQPLSFRETSNRTFTIDRFPVLQITKSSWDSHHTEVSWLLQRMPLEEEVPVKPQMATYSAIKHGVQQKMIVSHQCTY